MDGAQNCCGARARLEAGVAAVAKDRSGGVLAATEVDGLGFSGFELDRGVIGGLVAAVAEGLVGAQAAGTPVVAFAGFHLDGIRTFLSNFRFGHEVLLIGRYIDYPRTGSHPPSTVGANP